MFEVSDGMTIEEFRAQLNHRWPSDRHDEHGMANNYLVAGGR
jgi:hypothetical protein